MRRRPGHSQRAMALMVTVVGLEKRAQLQRSLDVPGLYTPLPGQWERDQRHKYLVISIYVG